MRNILVDFEEDALEHTGVGHLDGGNSGRYAYGSGENPFQHERDFMAQALKYKHDGVPEKEIAQLMGCKNTAEFRKMRSQYNSTLRAASAKEAKRLHDMGLNNSEIGRRMGCPDTTVANYLKEEIGRRNDAASTTADKLREEVEKYRYVDVGDGVANLLGISDTKLGVALDMLEKEGYHVYGTGLKYAQDNGRQMPSLVLCQKDAQKKELYDYEHTTVHVPDDVLIGTDAEGKDVAKPAFQYPANMDISRLEVRYAEDGGLAKDGLIELRRGVPDLSLGKSNYAQVRILVDGDRYLKGMAVYADDLPDGIDVRFNTNKTKDKPVRDVLKEISKADPNNPFGSLIKEHGGQSEWTDENGETHLSLINKRSDEGDWGEWSKELPAQFLSKQPMKLVRQQLNAAKDDAKAEFDDICSLENPAIKQKLLEEFADKCDTASWSLKAAALPRQKYQVILPMETIGDNEVYAPNYNDGENLALIRFPHGGPFEIPILKVNNKNAEGKSMMSTSPLDAVGISKKNADILSGADFDGDTVMAIPCNGDGLPKITNAAPLEGLKDFDPKMEYPEREGMKVMKKGLMTQKYMGIASNLITDMTIKGASEDEMAAAVRHSMVVIDAAKHKLDFTASEKDNNIQALKDKYQRHYDEDGNLIKTGGASTLLSRAKSPVYLDTLTRGKAKIDPETGEKIYKEYEETYVDAKGKEHKRGRSSNQMLETKDAFTLSSGSEVENAYAEYANYMKAMGNTARKELLATKNSRMNPEAKKEYAVEVAHLNAELNEAEKNQPRERSAQRYAQRILSIRRKYYEMLEDNDDKLSEKEIKKELKKDAQRALAEGRTIFGSKRKKIKFTDREWEAIQSGALSHTKIQKILRYSDPDEFRERATPRARRELSTAKKAKIRAMLASGDYTASQIANAVGCSVSAVGNIKQGKE